jgi:hypothetical protein
MAKLGSVIKQKPIALRIAGVYVQNLPAATFDRILGNVEQEIKDAPEDTIVKLFNELICDKAGKPFEDVATFEAITETLSMASIMDIVNAIPAALAPQAGHQGK